ncbi:G2 and S phase-expressed protein 1 isoform X1 [Phyllobates terribilis]|uniref:G2 and S phase-expressed protein 1 isoform X1 n=1 Tax=Phyllobates terribilis TaxID=111132 RepID=UPI003CCAE835
MDAAGNFTLLADEEFDFDISFSPTSIKEDNDDEVFVGPVGHKEKCVSAVLKSQSSEERVSPLNTDLVVWSPLSGDKFVEIFKEAHLLALQLESFVTNDQKKEEPPQTVPNPTVEKFVLESKSKLNLFDEFNEVPKTPVAIKRETYCIQESPFHQLPPSVQQRLTGSNKKAETSCSVESQNLTSPLNVPKVKSHVSSPLVVKPKASQIKSGGPSANNGKSVSKLQPMKAPAAHMKNNRLAVEKPKAIKKTSPARRKNLSSLGSTEDLLSDRSCMASDVSDSSFNTSIVGSSKRTLPVPKKAGLNKVQFKTPSAAAGSRRNTSSSSSNHSNTSLNSSLSLSPPAANAKLNASLNTSMNTSVTSSRLKPNTSRLALVRPHSGVGSSVKNTDLSNGRLKPATESKPAGNKSASVTVSQPQTQSGKFQRQTSAPNLQRLPASIKMESAGKGTSAKPQARVMPTPTSRLKLAQKQDVLSPDRATGKTSRPARLLSCGEIGSGIAQSTPLGTTKGMAGNLALRSISATPNSKPVSALPTPIARRASGIVTPRTIPRPITSLRPATAVNASIQSAKKSLTGSDECEQIPSKVTKSPCSPTKEDHTASTIRCSLNFSPESKPDLIAQSEETVSVAGKPSEDLLIDIAVDKADIKLRKTSSVDAECQPLIDLSNTPEFNKRLVPLKPANIGQLIDLSSPLITLSPVGDKENLEYDSPLLKF